MQREQVSPSYTIEAQIFCLKLELFQSTGHQDFILCINLRYPSGKIPVQISLSQLGAEMLQIGNVKFSLKECEMNWNTPNPHNIRNPTLGPDKHHSPMINLSGAINIINSSDQALLMKNKQKTNHQTPKHHTKNNLLFPRFHLLHPYKWSDCTSWKISLNQKFKALWSNFQHSTYTDKAGYITAEQHLWRYALTT